jgi:hypothetical protein
MPARKPSPTDAASVAARNAHRAEFAAAPSDALFVPETIATIACTTAKTLEAWRAIGRGPAWVRVGRNVRYRRRDVDAWLAAQDGAQQVAALTEQRALKPPAEQRTTRRVRRGGR